MSAVLNELPECIESTIVSNQERTCPVCHNVRPALYQHSAPCPVCVSREILHPGPCSIERQRELNFYRVMWS